MSKKYFYPKILKKIIVLTGYNKNKKNPAPKKKSSFLKKIITQLSELKKCSIFSANYKIELRKNSIFRKRSNKGINRQKLTGSPCFGHLNIRKFEFVSDFDIPLCQGRCRLNIPTYPLIFSFSPHFTSVCEGKGKIGLKALFTCHGFPLS
jgi:hypothetical protein